MRIYLKAFILNLTKDDKDVARSSFIPGRLGKLEKEMEVEKKSKAGELTVDDIMKRLKDEDMLQKAISGGDWKMIEGKVKEMMK